MTDLSNMSAAENLTSANNRPIRVMLVASWYPSVSHPLANTFIHEQAVALVESGMEVIVINANTVSFKAIGECGTSVRDVDGVHIFQTTVPIYGGGRTKPYIDATEKIIRRLYARAVKSYGRPDIIHIHSARFAGPVGSSIAKENHIPCILTEHFSKIIYKTMNEDESNCLIQTIKNCDKVIAVSPRLANELEAYGADHPLYIPNVVDGNTFHMIPERHENFTFISTAWLSKRKGMDILLRAFAKLKNKYSYVRLKICGKGTEFESLKALAAELEIDSYVQFTGERTRNELCEELNRSDCFVLASYGETFGVVYIEALACGLPIIATKCGGPECIVTQDNGLLVGIGDVDELASAMESICVNKENYNSSDIRNDCMSKYSCSVVANRLWEIYESCLGMSK